VMDNYLAGLSPDQIRAIPQERYDMITAMVEGMAPAIRQYVAEELAKAVEPLKAQAETLEAENAKLRARVSAMESKTIPDYVGTWQAEDTYPRGAVCTHAGAMWIATEDTAERPGDGASNWKLCVKSPRAAQPRPEQNAATPRPPANPARP
jgi:hypothetical protein